MNQAILLIDAALERRRLHQHAMAARAVTAAEVVRAAANGLTNLFGAIALATAGGTIFGTLGAMLVLPAFLVGRRQARS